MRGRHPNHVRSETHYRWNGERMMSEHGYPKIRVGLEHPLADPNGYAYEKLLVWIAAGRRRPRRSEILLNVNGCKSDNRIGNLQLMTRAAMNRLLNASRGRDARGRLMALPNGARHALRAGRWSVAIEQLGGQT